MKVVVIGASPKPERYSNIAIRDLMAHGHEVIPVHPVHRVIEGLKVEPSVSALEPGSIDTVTMYVGGAQSRSIAEDILRLAPRRAIFNPGSENSDLQAALLAKGIEVVEGCTLVMLRTGQF